jgi:hypothetical protein
MVQQQIDIDQCQYNQALYGKVYQRILITHLEYEQTAAFGLGDPISTVSLVMAQEPIDISLYKYSRALHGQVYRWARVIHSEYEQTAAFGHGEVMNMVSLDSDTQTR